MLQCLTQYSSLSVNHLDKNVTKLRTLSPQTWHFRYSLSERFILEARCSRTKEYIQSYGKAHPSRQVTQGQLCSASSGVVLSPDPTCERGSGDIRLIPWASLTQQVLVHNLMRSLLLRPTVGCTFCAGGTYRGRSSRSSPHCPCTPSTLHARSSHSHSCHPGPPTQLYT